MSLTDRELKLIAALEMAKRGFTVTEGAGHIMSQHADGLGDDQIIFCRHQINSIQKVIDEVQSDAATRH